MSVKEIKIHPDFDISEITYDYAIVKTAEDIDFTYGVNAACLPGVKDPKLTDGKFRFCNLTDTIKIGPIFNQSQNRKNNDH